MSSALPELHPFVRAWQVRDEAGWARALAGDVVLYSPLLAEPFFGRDAVAEAYAIAAPPLRWLFQLLQIIATRTGHGRP
jgi:hypothetical protein